MSLMAAITLNAAAAFAPVAGPPATIEPVPEPVAAQTAPPFGVAPVSDTDLKSQRGGIRLPNGIDVALSVQTQTAVDGHIVLRTVFTLDDGPAQFSVFTPRPGEIVKLDIDRSQGGGPGTGPGTGTVTSVTYDAQNGIQISRMMQGPVVATTGIVDNGNDVQAGLQDVTGRTAVQTDNGLVRHRHVAGNRIADLTADDLTIAHFAGHAFGSAIANMGNDRTIDTHTVISIGLDNVNPQLIGSTMLRVEGLGIAALQSRY